MDTNSYFTIEILSSGNLWLRLFNANGSEQYVTIYYWINKEPNANRDNYDGVITTTTSAQNIPISIGDKIKLYRAETTAWAGSESDAWYNRIGGSAEVNLSGNIASLIGFSETIPENCFRYIFYQSQIIDASELELPWLTLSQYCFARMFYGSAKLIEPPYLPATTLAQYCCYCMFRGCNSLKKLAKMACKNLNVGFTFYSMYQLCRGLEEVEIPLFDSYNNQNFAFMLNGCTGLKKLIVNCPETLSTNNMFHQMAGGCTSLEYVVCLAKTINSNTTQNWLNNCAASGTFIKHPDATGWTEGAYGIPSGWTVKNMNPQTQTIDYSKVTTAFSRGNISLSAIYSRGNVLLWGTPVNNYATQYFTAEIITGGTLWYMCLSSSYKWTIEYSKNGGTWYSLTADTGYGIGYSNKISVNAGDKIRFRKTGSSSSTVGYSYFWSNTCTYELYGNIMSLAYGDDFIGKTTIPGNYYFCRFCSTMNSGETNTWLKSVENLVLPATTLTSNCYDAMFAECTQITKAPVLPATTLVSHCYDAMFGGCTLLQYIKAMFTTTPGSNYTQYWVVNVPSGGTFVKNSAATWNVTGNNGVPSGWTIEYA